MIQLDFEGPVITKFQPAASGIDNAGIGYTKLGERYLMKTDPAVGIAEFIGAALCRSSGAPTCEPSIVTLKGRQVFGSRFEHGLRRISDAQEFAEFWKKCSNKQAMSGVLAVDLLLGNYDRHWSNWIYQDVDPTSTLLRAVDFSRAWPTTHPPMGHAAMIGENTHTAFRLWSAMGIAFDANIAEDVCNTLRTLRQDWIEQLLTPLPVGWKVSADGPGLCDWWGKNWTSHVDSVKDFLSNGAWK